MHICRLEDLYDHADLVVFDSAMTAYMRDGNDSGFLVAARLRRGVRAAIARLAETNEPPVDTVDQSHDPVPEMATPNSARDLLAALEDSVNAAKAVRRNKTREA
jgi:hypothetical protein